MKSCRLTSDITGAVGVRLMEWLGITGRDVRGVGEHRSNFYGRRMEYRYILWPGFTVRQL